MSNIGDEFESLSNTISKKQWDKLPSVKSMHNEGWTKCSDGKPYDDQTVFVINAKVRMLPIKAYYSADWDEFMSLENGDGTNHPLSITHWMELPKRPKE